MLTGVGPASGAVVGVDVGGTEIKAVLVDREATVIAYRRVGAPRAGSGVAGRVIDAVGDLVAALVATSSEPVVAVGLVVPGIVDEEAGVAVASSNLGWHDAPLRDALAARIGLPVAFGHDARAGGLAEARLGAARGLQDVVFLSVGTGISAALIIAGRMHAGGGLAGEIGHVDVGHGRPCRCGQAGCLETIASASAMARGLAARQGRDVAGAAEVAALVAAGDPDATIVWDDAVDALALVLAWVSGVLAPEAIVIGGGLSRSGDLLMRPLGERLERRLSFQRRPQLLLASLGEQAGCLGAALLALGPDLASAERPRVAPARKVAEGRTIVLE